MQLKICFLTWEVIWEFFLTLYQLQKRGLPLANRCYLCHEKEEMVDHLLLHCVKTRSLWELLFSLYGVTQVNPLLV